MARLLVDGAGEAQEAPHDGRGQVTEVALVSLTVILATAENHER